MTKPKDTNLSSRASPRSGRILPPPPLAAARLTTHQPLTREDADHPVFNLIGRVMAEWAQLEHILDLAIWDLTKHSNLTLDDHTVACITAQVMGPGAKCLTITALATLRGLPKSLLDQIEDISNKSNNLQNERNRMAHDIWFIDPESRKIGRYAKMAKKEFKFGVHAEDMSRIEELIQKIKQRQEEAYQLRTSILAQLSAL